MLKRTKEISFQVAYFTQHFLTLNSLRCCSSITHHKRRIRFQFIGVCISEKLAKGFRKLDAKWLPETNKRTARKCHFLITRCCDFVEISEIYTGKSITQSYYEQTKPSVRITRSNSLEFLIFIM